MNTWSWRYKFALCLSLIGIVLIVYFIFTKTAFNDYSFLLNSDLAAKFGDFIGGFIGSLFSLAGVFLLFETLIRQREAFERQQKDFQRQQIENNFFELLAIYRQNVSEMEHRPPDRSSTVNGRRVFIEMRKQFGEIYKRVDEIVKEQNVEIEERDKANIAYLILFFGLGDTSTFVLGNYLTSYEKYKSVVDEIIYNFSFEQATSYKYDGHQSRLGHYFRHLFQMVSFIDRSNLLSEEEKYFYVKILRAQMSTFELAIFFFNSLSDFGKAWSSVEGVNLIEKYHFLKNIPFGFTFDLEPKKYYPNVKFESEDIIIPEQNLTVE